MLEENNIKVFTFPSHCSHILQPLDISIFKTFKVYLSKNKKKYDKNNLNIKTDIEISENDKKRINLIFLIVELY